PASSEPLESPAGLYRRPGRRRARRRARNRSRLLSGQNLIDRPFDRLGRGKRRQLVEGVVDVVPTHAVAYGRLTGQGAIDGMEQMADEKVEAGGPASSRRVEGARQAPCLD